MLGHYWGVILSFFIIDLYNRLVIDPEEALLDKKYGQAYRDYKAKVRRWL